MQQVTTQNQLSSIAIEKLVPHPGTPNRMSKKSFVKLVRNIERTGRYEPLVVRPCPGANCHSPQDALRCCESRNPEAGGKGQRDCFQIINGYHRWKALSQLGYLTVDVVVWDVDDDEADLLLATLNRLGGSDVLDKKLTLMARLNQHKPSSDLAKLLPHTANQIRRLANMHAGRVPRGKPTRPIFANPVVFFLSDAQKDVVEKALSSAQQDRAKKTKAAVKAQALTCMAQSFMERRMNMD
jgi:ParB-like chromosome segregation protein Spo0J